MGFGAEEIVDLSPDLGSDGSCVGHCVVIRRERVVFMREWKAEAGGKLRVLSGEVRYVTLRVAVCNLGESHVICESPCSTTSGVWRGNQDQAG